MSAINGVTEQQFPTIPYTPPANAQAGDLVIANGIVGVMDATTAGNSQGNLRVSTNYLVSFPKATSAGSGAALAFGTPVYADLVNQVVTPNPQGPQIGVAASQPTPTDAQADVLVLLRPGSGHGSTIYQIGAQASDTVSNTSAETAFATTATIAASDLLANDVVHVRAAVLVTAQNGTNTNGVKLKVGPAGSLNTVLGTGPLNVPPNGGVVIDCDLVFTQVGSAGYFQGYGTQGSAAPATFFFANTAINTLQALTVEITDTQSAASAGNVAQLIDLEVTKKRK